MPLVLAHESLFERTVLEIPNEIAIAPRTLLPSLRRSAATSPLTPRIAIWNSVWRGRVVRRAGLQSDRLRGVKVTCHSLDSWRDPALLLLHCCGSLASSSGLGV